MMTTLPVQMSYCLIGRLSQTVLKSFVHDENFVIDFQLLDEMWALKRGCSDQQNSYYQLLIFNQFNSLFITGTMLYYMPLPATKIDITCSMYSLNPRTALDSFR